MSVTLVPFLLAGLLGWMGLWGCVMVRAVGRPVVGRWHRHGWHARAPRTRLVEGIPGVYVMWCGPVPVYVGQTVDARSRFQGHGKDVRALVWTHWTFVPVQGDLDEPERFLIRVLFWCRLLGMNKTRGGS